jgi:hypothetical protein
MKIKSPIRKTAMKKQNQFNSIAKSIESDPIDISNQNKNQSSLTPLITPLIVIGLALFTLLLAIFWIIFNLIGGRSMDLMIGNETGEKIVIQSCSLNEIPIINCSQELQNKENAFFDPQNEPYPKNNIFSMQVITKNGYKQYSCSFEKVSRSCMEEMALTNEELRCVDQCVDIY